MYVRQAVESLPASDGRLDVIRKAQQDVPTKFCQDGWPTRVYGTLKKYSALAPELAMEEGILMRANRIVIPARSPERNA